MERGFAYNMCPEDIREYIDLYCPFKIGDKVKITRDIFTLSHASSVTFNGEVVDIMPRFERDKLSYEMRDLIDRGIVLANEDELKKVIPEFVIGYSYFRKEPRKHWWKLWEKRTYKELSSTLEVDIHGLCINEISCISYTIEKID